MSFDQKIWNEAKRIATETVLTSLTDPETGITYTAIHRGDGRFDCHISGPGVTKRMKALLKARHV